MSNHWPAMIAHWELEAGTNIGQARITSAITFTRTEDPMDIQQGSCGTMRHCNNGKGKDDRDALEQWLDGIVCSTN